MFTLNGVLLSSEDDRPLDLPLSLPYESRMDYTLHSQEFKPEKTLGSQDFEQVLTTIRADVRSRLDIGVEEIKSFVQQTIREVKAELKSAIIDSHTDFYHTMSTWNVQMNVVSNNLQVVSDKLDRMPCKETFDYGFGKSEVKVDMQPVFHEVAKLSESLEKIHDRFQSSTSKSPPGDHQTVLAALSSIDAKVTEALSKIEMRPTAINLASDFCMPVLDEVKKVDAKLTQINHWPKTDEMKAKVDFQALLNLLDQMESRGRAETNQVINAIKVQTAETNRVLNAIDVNIKPSIDVNAIVDAMHRVERPMVKAQVDLQPVLDAIKSLPRQQGQQVSVDFSQVINHMDRIDSRQRGEANQLLTAISAINQINQPLDVRPQVNLQPVLEEIHQVLIAVKAISKIERVECQVDLQPVLDAIQAVPRYKPPKIDLSPILAAIQEIHVGSAGSTLRRPRSRSPSATRVGGGFIEAAPENLGAEYHVGSYDAKKGHVIHNNREPRANVGDTVNYYRVYQTSPRGNRPADVNRPPNRMA